jgi:rod shape-determining protein MreB
MTRDLAIDLGTANTLVYARGSGVVLSEPSVVAINSRSSEVLSVGSDARRLIGRTPSSVRAIRPLRDGVVAHLRMTEAMLRYFIRKAAGRRARPKPRVIVCVPSGVTEVEQRAVVQATKAAGAKKAFLIEEPMAAAIGAGLPVHEPTGNMIVDIGGGTTEVAVISFGGIVASTSLRVAGDAMDQAIIGLVKKKHALAIGERTAEALKVEIGAGFPIDDRATAEARGRDMASGLPASVTVTGADIREAIEEPVAAIVDAVRDTLDRCPPELAGDIIERGLVLTGGGALLRGMDDRIREEVQMPVTIANESLSCVAVGAGRCLEHFSDLREVLLADTESAR